MRMSKSMPWFAGSLLSMLLLPAHAALQPDSGSLLQENRPTPGLPASGPAISFSEPQHDVKPGGPKVVLSKLVIVGNSLVTTPSILAAVGPVVGKSLDFAEMHALTGLIADLYSRSGYPFVRVFLPAQRMINGELTIEVLEGRYGRIQVSGDPSLADAGTAFLTPLKTDAPIESHQLERAMLLLDDLPGVKAVPLIRPGNAVGQGDLLVTLSPDAKRFSGDVGVDNYGNYYTGLLRAHAYGDASKVLTVGDQLDFRMVGSEGMQFGSLAYALPLGANGWRGQLGYSHVQYHLGKSFSSLDARGTANIYNIGASYALLRSQAHNLNLNISYQNKQLHDVQRSVAADSRKSSQVIPVALNFDVRDRVLGAGAINYGVVALASGRLDLDAGLTALDATTARTKGSFSKLNLDVARLQSLEGNWALHVRAAAQFASHNLDSSEKFGIGGLSGVRAYPTGEGFGDEGWVSQLELRYAGNSVSPYVFYDRGHVISNRSPWLASNNQDRTLAGVGSGLRYSHGAWRTDMVISTALQGGSWQSDPRDSRLTAWASASYGF